MTGAVVYLNGQEIDNFNPFTLFGGPSQVGAGGMIHITAPVTNGMDMQVGQQYTLAIQAVFIDGSNAGASVQLTGGKGPSCG